MAMRMVKLAAAAALMAGVTGSALAADLDRIIYSPQIDRTVPVEIGNGWYLRGDIGYAVETDGGADRFAASEIDSEFSGSLGVGYQFTDWLRTDATADYSEGEFFASSPDGALCGVGPCVSESDMDAIGLMANAYVDLGTIVGITPYVGAGIGATRVDWGPFTSTSEVTGDSVVRSGEADWRLTYALMAGASYDLTKAIKLDFGYRFSDVAGGNLFTGGGEGGEDDGYTKHEIRAGFRYMLW